MYETTTTDDEGIALWQIEAYLAGDETALAHLSEEDRQALLALHQAEIAGWDGGPPQQVKCAPIRR
jgi:hypothetical protein